jgi:hypothetical protein
MLFGIASSVQHRRTTFPWVACVADCAAVAGRLQNHSTGKQAFTFLKHPPETVCHFIRLVQHSEQTKPYTLASAGENSGEFHGSEP